GAHRRRARDRHPGARPPHRPGPQPHGAHRGRGAPGAAGRPLRPGRREPRAHRPPPPPRGPSPDRRARRRPPGGPDARRHAAGPPLVAWNVWLPEGTLADARAIAARLREAGGGPAGLRALGLYMPERGEAQVSMNLEDLRTTPQTVVDLVRREAERLGVRAG